MEQVQSRPVLITTIMRSAAFGQGLEDARSGKPFDWRIDSWEYERGRLFGYIAPVDMPLRDEGGLNSKAIALCKAAFDRKLIV